MNQRQRNLILEALEVKALQDDEDTAECLELLELMGKPGVYVPYRQPVPEAGSHAANFGRRGCPKCSDLLEIRVFHNGGAPTRWPYCRRCGKRRHRALSVEDAIKFQKGQLQL